MKLFTTNKPMRVKFTAGVWLNQMGNLIEWNGQWARIVPDSAPHLILAIALSEFELLNPTPQKQ